MINIRKPSLSSFVAFGLIPAVFGIVLILKVFFIPGCFAFDWCDDVKHTFMGLLISRHILADHAIPMINLFHNFGTPILGDAITYPFAIQSLTYAVLPDYLAMTVNRFLVATFSVALLTYYYERSMSIWAASFSALLVLVSPGFLWHIAHHHYQMPVLFCAGAILLEERFTKSGKFLDLFYLYVLLIFMILSMNIQLVLISIPFILIYQWFISGMKTDAKWFSVLGVFAAAFLFYYPQVANFFILVSESMRTHIAYGASPTTREFLLCLASPQMLLRLPKANAYLAIFYSLPLLCLFGMGMMDLFKKKEESLYARRAFILGVVPTVIVLIFIRFQSIWGAIPLVKSVDITRILWISNIFLMPVAGKMLDTIWKRAYPARQMAVALLVMAALALFYLFFVPVHEMLPEYWISIALFMIAALIYSTFHRHIFNLIAIILFYASIALAFGFSTIDNLGLRFLSDCQEGTHHFSEKQNADYEPQFLLPYFEPYSRVATERTSTFGDDFKLAKYNLFGSMGRNPLPNEAFTTYVIKSKVAVPDESPLVSYHFTRPWNTELLSELGVKYVVQNSTEAEAKADNWPIRASVYENTVFLKSNPEPVSLVYFLKGNKRFGIKTEDFKFKGNGVTIDISKYGVPAQMPLVATFMIRHGWRAWVDGKERPVTAGINRMIRVDVKPGDKLVRFEYRPFEWYHFLGGILASLGLLFVVKKRLKIYKPL